MTDDGMLIDEREFFETLVENGSDAIVSIDEESRVVFANESVERVFGYAPEELVGERLTEVMPARFHDAHHAAVDDYLETGERGLDWNDIELPGEHRDGHEVYLSITFEEHEFEGDRYFSGIMRDVTDRRERERELERQNEQLEQFASMLSHDMRDPLNTAQATVTVAKASADEETAEYLAELEEIHERMASHVEEVLTLAKQGQQVGETKSVDLAVTAEMAWETVIDAKGAQLVVEDGLDPIEASPERLRTVLENVLGNAVHHGGPDVTVRVGPIDDPVAGETGFYVADDGPGVPEEDCGAVFDYGHTTSDSGTGFGLHIVKTVADAHGWVVDVTASADGGARFEFRGVETGEP